MNRGAGGECLDEGFGEVRGDEAETEDPEHELGRKQPVIGYCACAQYGSKVTWKTPMSSMREEATATLLISASDTPTMLAVVISAVGVCNYVQGCDWSSGNTRLDKKLKTHGGIRKDEGGGGLIRNKPDDDSLGK